MKTATIKKIAALALTLLALLSCFTLCAFAEDVEKDTSAVTDSTEEIPTIGAITDAPKDETTIGSVLESIFSGTNLALLGAALAVALPCMGSAKGVGIVGEASGGLLSENPSLFGKALALQALPMTQGIYGLVAAFMTLMNLGLFKNPDYLMNLTFVQGGYILMAALPIALAGLISAIRQGRVAATGINLIGKRPNSLGQAITTAALVETYAIFALLITILLIMRCPFRV
jgi:V/A-type H+-transporting ATPase subunit K